MKDIRPSKRIKAAAKNRTASVSPARKAAFDILLAVERGSSHADDLLRGVAIDSLPAPDRHLATALVLGVLRWQIRLDHEFKSLLKHPQAKLDIEILIALRLGAFQILHLDRIPARAAIDESVELAKQSGHRFASGMVNAVLRKLASAPRLSFPADTAANLALAEAHPVWMVERWARFYGLESAAAICRHGQSPPSLALRLAEREIEAELSQDGVAISPGRLLTAASIVTSGDLSACRALVEGRVRIQDEGSQLVAELAAEGFASSTDSGNAAEGRILDACAAPGGKTLILAERCPDAQIVACEVNATRFEQLRLRLAAHAGHVECRVADAIHIHEDSAFDFVLADVPCSGTGTLGRNPEIRHRLRPTDLDRHAERQRAIVASCLQSVRPGGRLIYSTCSLEPEENENVIAEVLNAMPSCRQVSLESSIEALHRRSILAPLVREGLTNQLTSTGSIRLIPGSYGTDGFYIAMIQRLK